MERQMLPFGKWFLDRKRKNNEEEKEKTVVTTRIRTPMSDMASQCLSHYANCTSVTSVSLSLYLSFETFDQTKWSCHFWLQHKEDMYMQYKTCRQAWVTNSFLTLNFFILQISQHTLNGKRLHGLVRKLDCPLITSSFLMSSAS